MKRTLAIILTAVFLFALSTPCGATGTETTASRVYPGFADVAEGSASYDAIKLCYERGLMNGASDTAFNPQGKLTVAQLVVLAARLYDLQCGGDGTVPDLPDMSQPYLRFLNEDGGLIASYPAGELPHSYTGGMNPYFCLSLEEEDASLPETCRLEVGFEGYNHIRAYQGLRQSYHSEPGTMTHGFQGTGYCFEDFNDPDGNSVFWYNAANFTRLASAWWYPALVYLTSENKVNLFSDLLVPLAGENQTDDYDALTHFSNDSARRDMFAVLVNAAAGELAVLNETVSAPDIDEETPNAGRILNLYRAGVLTGIDQAGNFGGDKELTRAQAAIMLARVLEPSLRVRAG